MTADQLAALMLAHPVEALTAALRVKIMGERGYTGARHTLAGRAVAGVHFRDLVYPFGDAPGCVAEHKAATESLSDFAARIDRLWVEAGWVLVDADGTVHRKVTP